jgi:hypothetical protein
MKCLVNRLWRRQGKLVVEHDTGRLAERDGCEIFLGRGLGPRHDPGWSPIARIVKTTYLALLLAPLKCPRLSAIRTRWEIVRACIFCMTAAL